MSELEPQTAVSSSTIGEQWVVERFDFGSKVYRSNGERLQKKEEMIIALVRLQFGAYEGNTVNVSNFLTTHEECTFVVLDNSCSLDFILDPEVPTVSMVGWRDLSKIDELQEYEHSKANNSVQPSADS